MLYCTEISIIKFTEHSEEYCDFERLTSNRRHSLCAAHAVDPADTTPSTIQYVPLDADTFYY